MRRLSFAIFALAALTASAQSDHAHQDMENRGNQGMGFAEDKPQIDGDLTEARIVGRVLLTAAPFTRIDDRIVGNAGMGGQGVLPVPVVYNDWVQKLPERFKRELTPLQRNPFPEDED
jgi:hypothetical protein